MNRIPKPKSTLVSSCTCKKIIGYQVDFNVSLIWIQLFQIFNMLCTTSYCAFYLLLILTILYSRNGTHICSIVNTENNRKTDKVTNQLSHWLIIFTLFFTSSKIVKYTNQSDSQQLSTYKAFVTMKLDMFFVELLKGLLMTIFQLYFSILLIVYRTLLLHPWLVIESATCIVDV